MDRTEASRLYEQGKRAAQQTADMLGDCDEGLVKTHVNGLTFLVPVNIGDQDDSDLHNEAIHILTTQEAA